jgi:4-hydroxy-4-methyl-2-oxoglutarate aldolase
MSRRTLLLLAAVLAVFVLTAFQAGRRGDKPAAPARPADPLLDAFRKVPVASVSDAVDQVSKKRGFLYHDMRAIFETHIAGRAVTALLRPLSKAGGAASPTLGVSHSVQAIDESGPGQVVVIVIEDGPDVSGLDIAGIGGLMATDAKARGLEGAIIDGGARDAGEIAQMGFPVFSRSLIPSTSVGRYTSVSKNEPVTCAGVTISPGDIIVGDRDGVVAVPKEQAQAVLKRAQEIDAREAQMFPLIRKFKSLAKVVEMFQRI